MPKSNDIADSAKDKKELQPNTANLDMPDARDIPGQEHVHVPRMGDLADTTISSDDEEGKGLLEDDASNVSNEEREALHDSSVSMSSEEDMDIKRARLDDKDLEGVTLNEKEDLAGDDLDVPGAGLDDPMESIGEEDEENNEYSLGGDNHDA